MDSIKGHHIQQDVVGSRPDYRDSRWERAVKVYTVNQESKYLLVQNVHALGVTKELLELFSLYGDIEQYRILDEYPSEVYCDVYWIKFARIGYARIAKRKLDNWSFYGRSLHVCYAPEFESVYETREKLAQRRKVVAQKTKGDPPLNKSPTTLKPITQPSSSQDIPCQSKPGQPHSESESAISGNERGTSCYETVPGVLPVPILSLPLDVIPAFTDSQHLGSHTPPAHMYGKVVGKTRPSARLSTVDRVLMYKTAVGGISLEEQPHYSGDRGLQLPLSKADSTSTNSTSQPVVQPSSTMNARHLVHSDSNTCAFSKKKEELISTRHSTFESELAGNTSMDRSIPEVRQHIGKVWIAPDVASISSHSKKRKRI